MPDVVCPYCMEEDKELYRPACCQHYGCRPCFEKCSKFATGQLLCPMCRRPFKLSELVKNTEPLSIPLVKDLVESQKKMRYCLNLFCQKGSSCELVHIDDIFPNQPSTRKGQTERKSPKAEASVTRRQQKEEEKLKVPEGALYCFDLLCKGGKDATCKKKHEQDIFRVPS